MVFGADPKALDATSGRVPLWTRPKRDKRTRPVHATGDATGGRDWALDRGTSYANTGLEQVDAGVRQQRADWRLVLRMSVLHREQRAHRPAVQHGPPRPPPPHHHERNAARPQRGATAWCSCANIAVNEHVSAGRGHPDATLLMTHADVEARRAYGPHWAEPRERKAQRPSGVPADYGPRGDPAKAPRQQLQSPHAAHPPQRPPAGIAPISSPYRNASPAAAPAFCTGTFEEADRPIAGTACNGGCIKEPGRWGDTFCWTDPPGTPHRNWGAPCVPCPTASPTAITKLWGTSMRHCVSGLSFHFPDKRKALHHDRSDNPQVFAGRRITA
eukprot:gene1437-biopygen9884